MEQGTSFIFTEKRLNSNQTVNDKIFPSWFILALIFSSWFNYNKTRGESTINRFINIAILIVVAIYRSNRCTHMAKINYPTRKLQMTQRESYAQFFLVLPPDVVRFIGWKKGDEIEIIQEDGDIRLHKKEDSHESSSRTPTKPD